jgi:uncharacterized lipoprotein YddW (UPF0748 family)
MNRRAILALLAIIALATSCVVFRPLPQRHRELRGVWVATVNNGDWPSRKDLTVDQQKQELVAMFDRFAALHLNAVFLQVRPAADAFYPSPYEPWSEFLAGAMGKGPEPAYDPLAFAIAAAHARGLELHAWFNPFRARRPSGDVAAQVVQRNPEHVHDYGRFVWMDPGSDAVQRDVLAVVADVVKRYDIDGVHLDDYFYPYPEKDASGRDFDFPDGTTWQQYRAQGGTLSRDDWRRDNINRFVRDLYRTVKDIKPKVEVGISPFGIWRPGNPRQIRGLDAYARIYTDSRLWLQNGWVDYFAPQLYWPIGKREQSFPVLLRWWTRQDTRSRGIVAGMSINRVATGRPNSITVEEVARQIDLVRRDDRAVGFILFSAKTLMQDRGGIDAVLGRAIDRGGRGGGAVPVGR